MGTSEQEGIVNFSIKTLLLIALGILFFGMYMGVLFYGENSLSVLNQLKDKKEKLESERSSLKNKNKKLQKSYFEYKQLIPKLMDEDAL